MAGKRSADTGGSREGDAQGPAAQAQNRAILARGAIYIAIVVGVSNLLVWEPIDRDVLVHARVAIAHLAGLVLNLVGYDATVSGARVFLSSSAVEIVNSCTGVDVSIFLAAAVLIFPTTWRARAIGVALSIASVFVMNFARVLTLCYFINTSRDAFETAHYYVWPGVIIVGCLGTLLFWIQHFAQPPEEHIEAAREVADAGPSGP